MGRLRIERIAKAYTIDQAWGAAQTLEVFDDISFTLQEGEFVCLLGPSGCGKSTLLNLVAGLDQPTAGAIYVDGKKVSGPGLDRGVVFQEFALFPGLTVVGNIGFGLRSMGVPKAERQRRIDACVDLVGLGASGLSEVRSAAAAASDELRNGLDELAGLEPAR